ncbi:MAG: carbamoyltransferase C-terminal domain-containing protein [Pseudonocardiaceae bacterium]
MWTLGINWKWHDSAAALVDENGTVWAFAEEERFTRRKHAWNTFPAQATRFCLATAGITWEDVHTVAVGWDFPHLRHDADQVLSTIFETNVEGHRRPELVFVQHHLAHGLSAFYSSGFERAGILIIDGSGEIDSATIYSADRISGLTSKRSWSRRYSLGSMYMAATPLLGFGKLDSGKTMGLAPYGIGRSGSAYPIGDLANGRMDAESPAARLSDESTFNEFTDVWKAYLANRVGTPTAPSGDLHTDPVAVSLAASAQRTVEETFRVLHAEAVSLSGSNTVCLAGGVALNCVANGLLPEPLHIPPFPHDAGVALGAAWSVCPPRTCEPAISPYLGANVEMGSELQDLRDAGYRVCEVSASAVARLVVDGRVGAVVEGRAEVGPRALGHRSIIALPRPACVRDELNAIKNREAWRPFAPVTLSSYSTRLWPNQGNREQYMIGTSVTSSLARTVMAAAVHVDGTTRPQVIPPSNGVVGEMLEKLSAGGVAPVLVNTSFNNRGEPIVNSARDALHCFVNLGLDFLVLGDQLVERRRPTGVTRETS